jgi:hypothetical protein
MADLQLRSFFTVRLWHREPSFLIAAQYVPDDSVAVSQGNRTLICTIVSRCYGIHFQGDVAALILMLCRRWRSHFRN